MEYRDRLQLASVAVGSFLKGLLLGWVAATLFMLGTFFLQEKVDQALSPTPEDAQ